MVEYNEATLQQYYDTRNYAGAANYLESVYVPIRSRPKINAHIRQLRRDAAIQASVLESATEEEKQAYNFMQGLSGNGTIPRTRTINATGVVDKQTNTFGDGYTSGVNNLKANNGNRLNRVAFQFENDEDFNFFKEQIGADNFNNNGFGLRYERLSNGTHRVIIDTDNKNLYKVLAATDRTIQNTEDTISWDDVLTWAGSGALAGATAGAFVGGVGAIPGAAVGGALGLAGRFGKAAIDAIVGPGISICGVDDKGTVYDGDEYNSDELLKAYESARNAHEIYDGLMKRASESKTATSEIVATQFLGAGDAEAYSAYTNGKITKDEYNDIHKDWEEWYERLLMNADFSAQPVFASSDDSEEGLVLTPIGSGDAVSLKGEVMTAMHDGRVSMSLAIKDGQIGTMLQIIPKTNDDGNWSKAKGEVQKTIFIPKLFHESANAAFERDTKTIAAQQNADMKRFGYEQTLSSGLTVGYDANNGSYIKQTQDGKTIKVPISQDEMLHTLNESAIIDQCVNSLLSNMDDNGNLIREDSKGNRSVLDLDTAILAYAQAGANELYPDGQYTAADRAEYQVWLYDSIRNILMSYIYNDNQ